MSRAGAVARIDTLLSSITDPTFKAVYFGDPKSIKTTPMVAFWVQSHDVDFETLGDVSTTTTMLIRAYFPVISSDDVTETIEQDLWDSIVNIRTKLRGDSNLNGEVTDTEIGSATTGFVEMQGNIYRHVSIPYEIDIYGEYPITP